MSQIQTDLPKQWLARIERCKLKRRQLVHDWQTNVDYRRGKPFSEESDESRININLDWSKTKAKAAQLFSQVPTVRLTSKNPQLDPFVATFAEVLNDNLMKAKIDVVMDEVLPDVINAAGIGAAIVVYERRTEDRPVPTVDPATAAQLQAQGQPVPTEVVPVTVDSRIIHKRISPADLLWPVEFTGSDFDEADFIGRSGVISWAEAVNEFNLKEEDKEKVVSNGKQQSDGERTLGDDNYQDTDSECVHFDEIFYWAYKVDPNAKSFKHIKRIVFVNGLDKPVIDSDWVGQKFDPSGHYLGACKFPIRVLTITYISDDCIPPSDSAIHRPQVNELIESRSQMILQRERSIPIRGFDPNKIDPEIQVNLLNGTWQNWVPIEGRGQDAIWEVARANYPREDLEFDRVAKHDSDEAWQISSNQAGSFASGERSASEAKIVQSGFETTMGHARAKVAKFFTSMAEVTAGLLRIFPDADIRLQQPDIQQWLTSPIPNELSYDIRPDSTVYMEAGQRFQRLNDFLNMTAKSGFVNIQPIIREMTELAGLNPAEVLTQPNPVTAPPLNISIRNREDLADPLMLALLIKTGQAPSPEELEAAKNMLMASQNGPQPTYPKEETPEGQMPPSMAPPMAAEAGQVEDMTVMPKINRRSDFR